MLRKAYRRYDLRLKNLVAESGDISRFLCYGIPKSTLRQWVINGQQNFFTIPEIDLSLKSQEVSVAALLIIKLWVNLLSIHLKARQIPAFAIKP